MIKQTILAASLGLLSAGNAMAFTNGDFSAGLTGWDVLGDVAVNFGSVVMTNASATYEDDFPQAAGTYNISGNEPGLAGGDVEAFAGLSVGDLDIDFNNNSTIDIEEYATEGSVLKQTISVSASDMLSFKWNFYTNEGPNADFAFVAIDGVIVLASTSDAVIPSVPFDWTTNAHTFSHTFATAGTYTISVGVVDVGDYAVSSALYVDNFDIAAAPVPEPRDWMLMLAGLGLVGLMVERAKRRPI